MARYNLNKQSASKICYHDIQKISRSFKLNFVTCKLSLE